MRLLNQVDHLLGGTLMEESTDPYEKLLNVDKFVGKYGADSKLLTYAKASAMLKVIEQTDKELVYERSKGQQVVVELEPDDLDFEKRILKKQIDKYLELVEDYYKTVYRIKFLDVEDTARKALNSMMKGITGSVKLVNVLSSLV